MCSLLFRLRWLAVLAIAGVSFGLAPLTLESYRRDFVLLGRFAAAEGRAVDALDLADLEAFVRDLMTRGYSPRSVARLVAAVRGFSTFRFSGPHSLLLQAEWRIMANRFSRARCSMTPGRSPHAPLTWISIT